jgi:hypothetical protein
MATLLQANQPSNMPQSGMAALGGAVQDGMAAKDQYGADAIRAQLMKRELDQRMQYGGADSSTANIKDYQAAVAGGYAKPFTEYLKEFQGREAAIPADIQKWREYSKLTTPEQKAEFLAVLRASQLAELGGVTNVVPPGVGAGVAQPQPLSTLTAEEEAKRKLADAGAQGAATGEARGTAIANLPVVLSSGRAALETVDKLLNHPGRAAGTGSSRNMGAGLQRFGPWSSDVKDFDVLRGQAQGQIFLDAYQSLKGGGVITEVEGLKAEQAKARMDAAQTDEEYVNALNDFKAAIQRGINLAEERAGGSPSSSAPSAEVAEGTVIRNPKTGERMILQNGQWTKQ